MADEHDRLLQTVEQIGYGRLGPFLVAFARWLRLADRDAALLFLARDAAVIRTVYAALYPERAAQAAYLPSSRAATALAALDSAEALAAAASQLPAGWTVAAALERCFQCVPSSEEAVSTAKLGTRDGRRLLREALSVRRDEILDRAADHRHATRRVLEMAMRRRRPIVVDIGYRGEAQMGFSTLLGVRVEGRYIVTHRQGLRAAMHAGRVEAFAGSWLDPRRSRNPFSRSRYLLEAMLSENVGSFLRYEADGRVRRAAMREPQGSCALRDALHRGALAFAQVAREHGATGDVDALAALLSSPASAEALALSGLSFDGGGGEGPDRLCCAGDHPLRRRSFALWAEGQAVLDRDAQEQRGPRHGARLLRYAAARGLLGAWPLSDQLRAESNPTLFLRHRRRMVVAPLRWLDLL